MRARLVAAAVATAFLLAGVLFWTSGDAGTGRPDRPSIAAAPTPTGTRAGTGPNAGSGAGAGAAVTPGPGRSGSPGAATDPAAVGFLTELGAIDPGLVADPARALRSGQDTCRNIDAHQPYESVVHDAVERFGTGGVSVTEAKATLIVDAARNHLCPG